MGEAAKEAAARAATAREAAVAMWAARRVSMWDWAPRAESASALRADVWADDGASVLASASPSALPWQDTV